MRVNFKQDQKICRCVVFLFSLYMYNSCSILEWCYQAWVYLQHSYRKGSREKKEKKCVNQTNLFSIIL